MVLTKRTVVNGKSDRQHSQSDRLRGVNLICKNGAGGSMEGTTLGVCGYCVGRDWVCRPSEYCRTFARFRPPVVQSPLKTRTFLNIGSTRHFCQGCRVAWLSDDHTSTQATEPAESNNELGRPNDGKCRFRCTNNEAY